MLVVVDFETTSIEPRPSYPPRPVGVALRLANGKKYYFAWGHPEGNNRSLETVRHELRHLWLRQELIFHNAAFDLEVAQKHLGLPIPPWHRVHDTMLLAFLHDPNAEALGLKELGQRLLHRLPEAQNRLRNWIIEHIQGARASNWGGFISQAPARLVTPYAKEDVELTWRLFGKLQDSLGPAYDRERKLLPILLQMSQCGLPLDAEGLQRATIKAEADLERTDHWLQRRLKTPGLDLDKGEQLADAIENCRLVEGGPRKGFTWLTTEKTGKRSTAIPALREVVTDSLLVDVLEYRSLLTNQLRTFARPWLAMGERIYCNWNQVRHHEAKRPYGARTGRLSSNPNLQNIPYRMQTIRRTTKGEGLYVPIDGAGFIDLRSYVKAPRWTLLGDADYNQQELRVLAHFVGGPLAQAYRDDPQFDLHAYAQRLINDRLPIGLSRIQAKGLGFGILYGMGLDSLGERIGTDRKVASQLRRLYKQQLGIETLDRELRERRGCKTWGGRWYDIEPPAWVAEDLRTFEYKLVNTLIQGSSADVTKEAMIRYDEVKQNGELLLTVHDELVILAPTKAMPGELRRLRQAMESIELKVPLIAEGKSGRTWREAH